MIKVNYDKETGRVLRFNQDTEPYIEITEEERNLRIPNSKYRYWIIDGKFTIKDISDSPEEKKKEIERKISANQQWFLDND